LIEPVSNPCVAVLRLPRDLTEEMNLEFGSPNMGQQCSH